MIISSSKPFEEILENLDDPGKIFVLGCGVCATKLQVGGEPEVETMCRKLRDAGKEVIGGGVAKAACSIKSKESLLENDPAIEKADTIIVMSCGSGLSVVSSLVDVPVHPATNTDSLGGYSEGHVRKDLCAMCGSCIADFFGGVCPTARCPKGLMNGPCGGAMEGKCEVDRDRDCAWELIYLRLKEIGRLDLLEKIFEPKEYDG
jgi:hypothetical protein